MNQAYLRCSAAGRPDVERATEFSSHRSTQEIDADLKGEDSDESTSTARGRKRKLNDDNGLSIALGETMKMIADRQSEDASRDKERLQLETERLKLERERAKRSEEIDAEQLTLERERSQREAASMEQRLHIEMERNAWEEEAARIKRRREDEDSSLKKFELYNKLSKSDSVLDRALAKKMESQLIDELGLQDYM